MEFFKFFIWVALAFTALFQHSHALKLFRPYVSTKYRIHKQRSITASEMAVQFPQKINTVVNNGNSAPPSTLLRPNKLTHLFYPNPQINEVIPVPNYAKSDSVVGVPQPQIAGSFCRRSVDGQPGYCMVAEKCLHVLREHRMYAVKFDICSYRGNTPLICCPLKEKRVEETRISAKKCHEYYKELDRVKLDEIPSSTGKSCVSSLPMIVGGQVVNKGEYPHMAALGWTQDNGEINWNCGGTLISEEFVLTAAHCIKPIPPNVVRLGSMRLNNSTTHQDIPIANTILHPKYNGLSYYHDIALIRLARPVQLSALVRPACLWQLPQMPVNKLIATGWGRTSYRGSQSNDLQKVEMNAMDQQFCRRVYRRERRLARGIMPTQFCAGYLKGGRDTCQGDSGGPLYAEVPEMKCVKFVVGITSFGRYCGAVNSPGVYTKISAYLDWIENIVFKS